MTETVPARPIDSVTLEDARSVIEVACALGDRIPVISGMTGWIVQHDRLPNSSGPPDFIGVYATREAAERGFRNHLVAYWTDPRYFRMRPPRRLEVNTATDGEVIDAYFGMFVSEVYSITEIQVTGKLPDPHQWDKDVL